MSNELTLQEALETMVSFHSDDRLEPGDALTTTYQLALLAFLDAHNDVARGEVDLLDGCRDALARSWGILHPPDDTRSDLTRVMARAILLREGQAAGSPPPISRNNDRIDLTEED